MTIARVPLLGWAVFALAVVTNVLVKVINFSLGEYDVPELAVRATMNAALGIIYAVCAVVAWRQLPTRLAGWLMVAVSLTWQAGSWLRTAVDVGWLWPVFQGLSNFWAILVGLLVFCYPTGRITRTFDRVVLLVALALFSVRFVATLLLDREGRIVPTCPCALNPYALFPNSGLAATVEDLWRFTGLALIIVVSVRVIVRWFASSPPSRRTAFVMPFALMFWALASIYEIGGELTGLPVLPGLFFVTPLTISAIPIAFVAGIVHLSNLRARVSDLVVIARDGVDRTVWQDSLARTLDDPSLTVYWWDEKSGAYLDSRGERADPEKAGADRRHASLLRIDAGDSPLAVLNHDIGVTENIRLLEGVAAALRLSVDNDRLRRQLEKTLQDVRDSRLRIVEAGDHARARIERDLHDGSQQVLVSVAINLRMIAARARASGNPALGDQLDAVSAQLGEALSELRALARGIHPTALTEGGLAAAVRELAARCPIPVDLDVSFSARAAPLVESTVYFVVAECLTNTAKHADASRASVRIAQDEDALVFAVSDDGTGDADTSRGSGLSGVTDRVEALGGTIGIVSAPGKGTTVEGRLPLQVRPAANPPADATAQVTERAEGATTSSLDPARV